MCKQNSPDPSKHGLHKTSKVWHLWHQDEQVFAPHAQRWALGANDCHLPWTNFLVGIDHCKPSPAVLEMDWPTFLDLVKCAQILTLAQIIFPPLERCYCTVLHCQVHRRPRGSQPAWLIGGRLQAGQGSPWSWGLERRWLACRSALT